ncbi:MAG: MlaC/ttg2D family ABC transporter substrate-binding protein [Rhodospirillaceae bacterium]
MIRLRRFAFVALSSALAVALIPTSPSSTTFSGIAVAQAQESVMVKSDPSEFITELSRYAIEDILKADVDQQGKIDRFQTLLDTAFDLPGIGRFVVGAAWRKASDTEKEEFQKLFRELNVINWGSRFDEYGGQTMTVTKVTPDSDKGHFVETEIGNPGSKPIVVTWRVRKRGDALKVIDIVVEGVSMALTFRSEYKSVLKNTGSMTGLNEVIQEKIAKLQAQQS